MKKLCLIALLTTTAAAAAPLESAPPERRNGKRHALDLDVPGVAGVESWFAVGAEIPVAVPSWIETGGHSPPLALYDAEHRGATITAHADALATRVDGEIVYARCSRAGTFELDVIVAVKGGPTIEDSIDLRCTTPTRFTVTPTVPGRYLAGGTADVELAWFGRRADGSEVRLASELPVTVPATEHTITLDRSLLHLVRPSKGPKLTSAGLDAIVPIEIVSSTSRWTLDVAAESHKSEPARVWVKVRAHDDHGALLGISGAACSTTSYLDDVATKRSSSCSYPIVRRSHFDDRDRHHRSGDWTADRICVTSLGRTTCIEVS